VASPSQLAFLNTLSIHPSFTSRLGQNLTNDIAGRALAYLRAVLSLTGPIDSGIRSAFLFRRGSAGGGRYSSHTDSGDSGNESDCIEGRLAKEHSVWRRAGDFWSALGWAFHCASAHPHRWRYWKAWLGYMVDVLETDWDIRFSLDEETSGNRGPKGVWKMLRGSLLVAYLGDLRRERKSPPRETMRALMAFTDDDPSDKAVYREIFERELTMGPRRNKRKRTGTVGEPEQIPLDKMMDWSADSLDSDSDPDSNDENLHHSDSPTPRKPRRGGLKPLRGRRGKPGRADRSDSPSSTFRISNGINDSVPLRLRLFRLLSAAANYVPQYFCSVDDLYESFADRVRGLPLSMFRVFVESQADNLPDFIQISLLRQVADGLLPNNRPDPYKVDPKIEEAHGISSAILERCYLPFAAGRVTPEDNAKLALVLQSMLWLLCMNTEHPPARLVGLETAVEEGIAAREGRTRRRNNGFTGADKEAQGVLERSARTMRTYFRYFKQVGEEAEKEDDGQEVSMAEGCNVSLLVSHKGKDAPASRGDMSMSPGKAMAMSAETA